MSYGPVKARAERVQKFLAAQTPPVQATLEPVDERDTITIVQPDGTTALRVAHFTTISNEAVLARLKS
jgi:hypothetical protein